MVSIGQGASSAIQSNIEGLGSNLLTVMPGTLQPGRGFVSSGRGAAQTLKNEDVEALQTLPNIAYISPEFQQRFQVTSDIGNNTNTLVLGIIADYAVVRNLAIANGTFISDQHNRNLSRVAVLGPTVAEDLFGDIDPIGRTVRINKVNFKVIGVLVPRGGSGFASPDDTILAPLTTVQKVLAGADHLSAISISVANQDDMPYVQTAATELLIAKHRTEADNPDFSIISQQEILGTLTTVTTTFTIFLAAVAGISLVVGGIGIMNMMLTTVTERTKEIGLRKAIGAKQRDIRLQFLTEAIMLTLIGGFIGIALGSAIAYAVTLLGLIQTSVSAFSIFLAFGVSAVIGIVFGYYPAARAAKLNPIDALRYE
jgi:putative ABC transport system permease protein